MLNPLTGRRTLAGTAFERHPTAANDRCTDAAIRLVAHDRNAGSEQFASTMRKTSEPMRLITSRT
jgi:hypothetical protein